MNTDVVYRAIFVISLFIMFGISGYFRRRADRRGEDEISFEAEGPVFPWLRKLFGIAMLGSSLIYIVRPRLLAWATFPVPETLRVATAVYALAIAPVIFIWVFSNLGDNVTPTVITRGKSMLVERGPYRWIRHPLYTFAFVFWVLISLFTQIWVFAILGVAAFLMMVFRTPLEEARLIERHGDVYRDYIQRTGRFLPRIIPST